MKALGISTVLLLACVAIASEKATVTQLLKDKKFDKKVVSAIGTVSKFQQRKSSSGHAYFLFKLVDKADMVNVYGQGELKGVKDKDKVQVTGLYEFERKSGSRVYKNEIDATLSKKGNEVKLVK